MITLMEIGLCILPIVRISGKTAIVTMTNSANKKMVTDIFEDKGSCSPRLVCVLVSIWRLNSGSIHLFFEILHRL